MKTFSKLIPTLVGLLFLYAGINKLIYPVQAIAALEVLGVRYAWADVMVFAAIVLELYLGVLLVLHVDLKWALSAAMGMMFVFVLFMWYLSMQAKPSSCGCLGLAHLFNSSKHEAFFGLIRNCAILWLLNLGYALYFKASEVNRPAESKAAAA